VKSLVIDVVDLARDSFGDRTPKKPLVFTRYLVLLVYRPRFLSSWESKSFMSA